MGGMSVLLLMDEGPTLALYQKNARYSCGAFRGPFWVENRSENSYKNPPQIHGPAVSFLAGETVGCCLTAHAGPSQAVWHYRLDMEAPPEPRQPKPLFVTTP